MKNIWFTSDTHYFHKNIAGSKVSKWKSGYRDFEDEKEMSRHLVKVFNQTVAEEDVLYHLGDWSFGGIQNIWNFRKQLRCKNIHLILGNHDEHIRSNKELPNVYRTGIHNQIQYDDGSYSRELEFIPTGFSENIDNSEDRCYAKELFTSVQDVLTVTHDKHTFFMSHYSHRVWYGSHKGIIHLYGHSHSSLENQPWGKSMDVGVDNAKKLLGEYRPFSIEEVIDIMSKREVKFVDNHNSKTNIR